MKSVGIMVVVFMILVGILSATILNKKENEMIKAAECSLIAPIKDAPHIGYFVCLDNKVEIRLIVKDVK